MVGDLEDVPNCHFSLNNHAIGAEFLVHSPEQDPALLITNAWLRAESSLTSWPTRYLPN